MPRMVNKRTRFLILRRDEYKCYYCGATTTDSEVHLDHIVPYSKGGATDPSNLVTACVDCNLGKNVLSAGNVEAILADVKKRNERFGLAERIKKTESKRKHTGRKPLKEKEKVYDLETDLDKLVQAFLEHMTETDLALLQEIYLKGNYDELEESRGFFLTIKEKHNIDDIFDRTCQFIHTFTEEEFQALTGYHPKDWFKLSERPVRLLTWNNSFSPKVHYGNVQSEITQRPYHAQWSGKDKTVKFELNCSYRPFYDRFIHEVLTLPKPKLKRVPTQVKKQPIVRPGLSFTFHSKPVQKT